MKIIQILTEFSTNTYIVSGEEGTVVIDPGGSANKIVDKLNQLGRTPDAVLLTHGHYDHTYSCAQLENLGAKVYMSNKDDFLVSGGGHVASQGLIVKEFSYTDINDGDTISIKDLEFKVLATPGHTPGSVCFLCENYLFSGDTLFNGTIGRTDFPGGDINQMNASLKKIAALSDQLIILPGHGGRTDIKTERRINPFLK